jgi:hypothetical protein
MSSNMYGAGLATTRSPLTGAPNYEWFLSTLGAKDRVNAEKHVAICQAGPDPRHAVLWQQLASNLMALAGHSAKVNRQPPSAQFFTIDGKYRMQVFAIEDDQGGELRVYCADVLDQAVKEGILVLQEGAGNFGYRVSDSGDPLMIEPLDRDSTNPAPGFKDMIGWNRKAIRVILPVSATESQIAAVNSLCALSVRHLSLPRSTESAPD